MSTVTAIFQSADDAREAIRVLRSHGVDDVRLNVLASRDSVVEEPSNVPPGRRKRRSRANGFLGLSADMFLLPGLGPISGAGTLAAGLARDTLGTTPGKTHAAKPGLPREDVYFYESALRNGGVVIAVEAADDDEATRVRNLIERAGGRSVQSVRRDWWRELRDGERVHVEAHGVAFEANEPDYHAGFESALHPSTRGRRFDDVVEYVKASYPGPCGSQAFRIGFERGQEYFRHGYRWPREAE